MPVQLIVHVYVSVQRSLQSNSSRSWLSYIVKTKFLNNSEMVPGSHVGKKFVTFIWQCHGPEMQNRNPDFWNLTFKFLPSVCCQLAARLIRLLSGPYSNTSYTKYHRLRLLSRLISIIWKRKTDSIKFIHLMFSRDMEKKKKRLTVAVKASSGSPEPK